MLSDKRTQSGDRFVPQEDCEGFTAKGSELSPESEKTLSTWKTGEGCPSQERSTCRGTETQKFMVYEGKSGPQNRVHRGRDGRRGWIWALNFILQAVFRYLFLGKEVTLMENELKRKKPKTERPVGRQLKGSRREDTVLAQAWNWGRREENGCRAYPGDGGEIGTKEKEWV